MSGSIVPQSSLTSTSQVSYKKVAPDPTVGGQPSPVSAGPELAQPAAGSTSAKPSNTCMVTLKNAVVTFAKVCFSPIVLASGVVGGVVAGLLTGAAVGASQGNAIVGGGVAGKVVGALGGLVGVAAGAIGGLGNGLRAAAELVTTFVSGAPQPEFGIIAQTNSTLPQIGSIKPETMGNMEAFRLSHNPGVSSNEMIGYVTRGAELFQQIQLGTAPNPASFNDVLSVSWFTTTCAMDGGQELAKGSARMVDEGGKIDKFLKGFKNEEPVKSGLPRSSSSPYERFSSHYNGISVNQDKFSGRNDRQFGIESYENRAVFPGGTNCILWNAIKVPGSEKQEVFIKFEEKGFPIPTDTNIGQILSNPKLSIGQKIGSVYRDIGRCFAHCNNFASSRGHTGTVSKTQWKEHTSTNKPLETTFKGAMKSILKNESLSKEIRLAAKENLKSLTGKEMFFGQMEGALTSIAEEMAKSDNSAELTDPIKDIKAMAQSVKNGLDQFMTDNKHEDIGMIRKGNEVHVDPFLKSKPNPDQPA